MTDTFQSTNRSLFTCLPNSLFQLSSAAHQDQWCRRAVRRLKLLAQFHAEHTVRCNLQCRVSLHRPTHSSSTEQLSITPVTTLLIIHRHSWIKTRKPSLEDTPTTSATFLANHEFPAACYLHIVSNSCLLFVHSAVTGFPNFTFTFLQ